MSDKILTPSLNNANYAQEHQSELKTFEFIHNDKVQSVQAKTAQEASEMVDSIIKNADKVEVKTEEKQKKIEVVETTEELKSNNIE
jgi:hypothetical protein